VDSLYNDIMSWKDDRTPADVFLMSKGHGCMIQYVILEERDILQRRDLEAYCKPEGRLGAHPDFGTPGIAAATGSLGHGMGMAVGMAYAEKLQRSAAKIYLVLSDGECQEGSTWEAAMMAGNLKLDNLTAFVDYNDFSGLDRMSEAHPAFHPLGEKFRSFGWDAIEVDGHSQLDIVSAAERPHSKRPLAVICKTVKGKGVSYMENVPIWHYRSPNAEEYAIAMQQLQDD
jgi:transketolase